MGRTKKTPKKYPLGVRSITLTPEADELLQHLSQDASDALGWTVSSSAIVRALLRHVAQQSPTWTPPTLFPLIEREIAGGRVWGSKSKKAS